MTAARSKLWIPAVALLSLSLAGCNDFVFRTLMEGEHGAAWAGPLTIVPGSITVEQGKSADFTAKGGSGVYRYSIPSGLGGSTIDAAAGHYLASPAATGTETVRVTDSTGRSSDARVLVAASAGTSPDYAPAAVTYPGGPYTAGAAFAGSFQIAETASAVGGRDIGWTVYLSGNATPDAGDIVIAAGSIAGGLAAGGTSGPHAFGGNWPASGGTYQLIIEITAADDVNPANNRTNSGALVVPVPFPPDYAITAMTPAAPVTVSSGTAIAESFTFANSGAGAGSVTVYWEVYLSTNPTIDGSDMLLASGIEAGLATGASLTRPAGGVWPAPGTYYLIARVTAADDTVPGNNELRSALVTVQPPDYVVSSVSNVGGVTATQPISGQFSYRNQATVGNGTRTVTWKAYVSTLNVLNGSTEVLIDSGTTPLLAAATTSGAIPFDGTWPASTAAPYYLIVQVSASDEAVSPNEASVGPFALSSAPLPNVTYVVASVNNTGSTGAGSLIQGNFTYRDTGTDNGTQTVYWSAYYSPLNTLNGVAETLVTTGTAGALNAGQTSAAPVVFAGTTWPATGGPFYLIVQVGASDSGSVNQGASGAVGVQPPDYVVQSVTNTGGTTSNGPIAGQFTYHNQAGTGNGTKPVTWKAFYSSLPALDGSTEVLIDSGSATPLVAGGTAGPIVFDGIWPTVTAPQTMYLIVQASAADDASPGVLPSAPVTLNPRDVRYAVSGVVNTSPTSTVGDALSGGFTADNIGSANGGQIVHWTAYLSTDAALAAPPDTVIDSGTHAAMTAGGTANITFAGTWPSTPGNTYYLWVAIAASDDTDPANNAAWTGPIVIGAPDYAVTSVLNAGTLYAGGALNATFTLDNVGVGPQTNGDQTVTWTAYISTDPFLDGADQVADSGTHTAMTAAAAPATVPFHGTWPAAAGSYYLIVQVNAADETPAANNTMASGAIVVINPSANYQALSVTYGGGYALPTGAVNGTFTFRNNGPDSGTRQVSYVVYASLDTLLDPSTDAVVANGTTSPLAFGATSGPIAFAGTWPLSFGDYHLIVKVSSQEDSVPGNDTFAAAGTTAVGILVEGEPNGDCTTFVDADDLLNTAVTGVRMRPGMSLKVTGTMPMADLDDVFMINTGSATQITTSWTLAASNKDMGIFYYQASPSTILYGFGVTGSPTTNSLSMTWMVDSPNATRYVDLYNAGPGNLGAYTCIIAAD